MKNGLKLEARSLKDWVLPKSAPVVMEPIIRDISGIPVVFQGSKPDCVPAAITWLKQYLEKAHPDLSFEWLAKISGTDQNGTTLGAALEAARKQGICTEAVFQSGTGEALDALQHVLPAYAYMFGDSSVYEALKADPVIITLKEYNGSGPHCMVITGLIKDDNGNLFWTGVNWDSADVQGTFSLPVGTKFVDTVAAILNPTGNQITMSFLSVLYSKFQIALTKVGKKGIAGIAGALMLLAGAGMQFGNAGVATSYATVIAGSGINSSVTSIPVASRTLFTGELITTSTTQFPAYFVINQGGSTQEIVECWNLSTTTTNPTWTGCVRGITALGGATSTVSGAAKAHAPGERFIMSNVGPFFNRFVDIYTTQDVNGWKSFKNTTTTFGGETGGIVWFDGTDKLGYTNDGVSSFTFDSGSSGLTASTTKGVFVTASEIGVNIGSSGGVSLANGLTFSSGALSVAPSSTAFLFIDSDGRLAVSSTALAASSSIAPPGYYGDGSAGASTTVAGTTTLTGDVYLTTYVVSTGTTLVTNGFRVFAKTSITNNGIIQCNGVAGTDSVNLDSNTTTGGLGCGSSLGSLPAGAHGGRGGSPHDSGGQAGISGSSSLRSIINTAGLAGGAGGLGATQSGFAGGAAGTFAASLNQPKYYTFAMTLAEASSTTIVPVTIAPGNGGGGTGGNDGTSRGGGGGAAGGNGGIVFLASPLITNNFIIRSLGGAGGAASNGQTNSGGGGGGSGGNGGAIIIIAGTFLGATPVVTGGAAGAAGAGVGTGVNGTAGSTGNTGQVFSLTVN